MREGVRKRALSEQSTSVKFSLGADNTLFLGGIRVNRRTAWFQSTAPRSLRTIPWPFPPTRRLVKAVLTRFDLQHVFFRRVTGRRHQSDTLGSSLRVLGNIVEHPNGVALAARATGPMVVESNFLMSLGNNASAQQAGIAHAVALVNVGLPWEAIDLPANEPSSDRWRFPSRTGEYLQKEPGTGSVGGIGAPGEGGGIIGSAGASASR